MSTHVAAEQPPTRPVRIWGQRKSWFRTWGFPLVLITLCPPLTVLLWIITVGYGGSITDFIGSVTWDDLVARLPRPTLVAGEIIGVWFALQLILLKVLPGKIHHGPFTPMG